MCCDFHRNHLAGRRIIRLGHGHSDHPTIIMAAATATPMILRLESMLMLLSQLTSRDRTGMKLM